MSQTHRGVVEVALFVLAPGRRVNGGIVPIQDHRNDYVLFARVAEHALKLLPVRKVETGIVESWVGKISRPLRHPGIQIGMELPAWANRLTPITENFSTASIKRILLTFKS